MNRFDRASNLIVVRARLWGPVRDTLIPLALDTGVVVTLVSRGALLQIGYDPDSAATRLAIATASAVESVPRISVARFEALGQQRQDFAVLAHTLPPGVGVEGLLGLNFLRGHRLSIDFRAGIITLD